MPRGFKRAFANTLHGESGEESKILLGHVIPGGLKHQKVKHQEREPIAVPPHLFDLHTMAAFVGAVKSGKTNAAVLLAHAYVEAGCFTRIFIMCPSWESNGAIFQTLPVQEKDIFKNINTVQADLQTIQNEIKKDAETYQAYKRYYDTYQRYIQGEGDVFDEALVKAMNYEEPIDPGTPPSNLLILDDLSHSPVYQSSGSNIFTNLSLRHRHLHGVGVTIFNLVQTFRGGVPLPIRRSTQQFFLFRTEDQDDLASIYTEVGNLVDKETFIRLFRAATKEKHCFLTVDKWRQQFRKNFDILIEPTDASILAEPKEEEGLPSTETKGEYDPTYVAGPVPVSRT